RPARALDVIALGDRRNDGRVGAGTPDVLLLERFHQRSVGVPRRRLGEVLIGAQRLRGRSVLGRRRERLARDVQSCADLERREPRLAGIVFLVEAVELLETRELWHASRGAKTEPAGPDLARGRVVL